MISHFFGRVAELDFLRKKYDGNAAELIVIYGRRRVGKTELLLESVKKRQHVYFLASETSEKDNLQEIFSKTAAVFNDESLLDLEKNWDNLFKYLSKKQRIIFIIDEFPYLVSQNKAIPSIFQKSWDTYLKNSGIALVLTGSSVGMMEEHVLAYKAPLYGRRTGQWKVEPMKFRDVKSFFPKYSLEERVRAYGALDGIPAYLAQFDSGKTVWENMVEKILSKGEFLYNETDFLLKQELREPKTYKNILKTIAAGNTKFSEIINATGIEKTKLFAYIDTMESLNIVEKKTPVFQHPTSKKSRYYVKDNFFNYWFKYILPNQSMLEEGKKDEVMKKIKSSYDEYIGRIVFEKICREFLLGAKLPFNPQKIGAYWDKNVEIDLIALNEETSEILFAECKWSDNVNAPGVLNTLKEKAKQVEWHKENRKEHYVLFAKTFKAKTTEKNTRLIDEHEM